MASRDFGILSVDRTSVVQDQLNEDSPATALSIVDHYRNRPIEFERITLLDLAQKYTMPRGQANDPSVRTKEVVVIVKPHYYPDPDGPHYEDYCR